MSQKKRKLPKFWKIIGIVLLVIICVRLIGIVTAETIGRFSKTQVDNNPTLTPVPTATSVYQKGVIVILDDPGGLNDKVELWLIFRDCDIDVVYNYVPNGTTAALTGKMCHGYAISYGEANFYEVRFSSKIEDLQGDNFWVDEKYMSVGK